MRTNFSGGNNNGVMSNLETHSTLAPLSQKDKSIVYIGVIAVILVSWLYLLNMAPQHSQPQHSQIDMSMISMLQSDTGHVSTLYDFLILFLMWSVMMTAMMLPSILPATTIFTAFNQRKKVYAKPYVRTYIFVIAYLSAWIACSLFFALTQLSLSTAGVLDSAMKTNNPILSSGVLILAGIYQWTPLKDACLRQCKSPLSFFIERWREGHWGAIYMGWHHGLFCIGCCWALMAIMFAVGAMNILWMAILSIFILCEKISPQSTFLRNITGVLLVCWGGSLLLN